MRKLSSIHKCAGSHSTSECTKTCDQPHLRKLQRCNTANYRLFPFSQVTRNLNKNQPTPMESSSQPIKTISLTKSPPMDFTPTPNLNYADITKSKLTIKIDKVITLLMKLFSAILMTEDPKIIISVTTTSF